MAKFGLTAAGRPPNKGAATSRSSKRPCNHARCEPMHWGRHSEGARHSEPWTDAPAPAQQAAGARRRAGASLRSPRRPAADRPIVRRSSVVPRAARPEVRAAQEAPGDVEARSVRQRGPRLNASRSAGRPGPGGERGAG